MIVFKSILGTPVQQLQEVALFMVHLLFSICIIKHNIIYKFIITDPSRHFYRKVCHFTVTTRSSYDLRFKIETLL